MAIEKKEVQVAKEVDDVMALLVGLVADVKAKKPMGDIVSHSLPALMSAIDGVGQVPAEVKENMPVVLSTVGARVGELAGVLVA